MALWTFDLQNPSFIPRHITPCACQPQVCDTKKSTHTRQAVYVTCSLPFCIWIKELNRPQAKLKKYVLYNVRVKIMVSCCPCIWEACHYPALSVVQVQPRTFVPPCPPSLSLCFLLLSAVKLRRNEKYILQLLTTPATLLERSVNC